MIWTYTGVPRKNQMYTQAIPDRTWLSDRRMTASRTPPAAPMAIEMNVSSIVSRRPCMVVGANM